MDLLQLLAGVQLAIKTFFISVERRSNLCSWLRCLCLPHSKLHTNLPTRREENQLDVTECFIALMIRSTCFGHFYAHHQELETICFLLPPMVCSAWLLVVGGQVQSSRMSFQEEGCCMTSSCSITLPGLTD